MTDLHLLAITQFCTSFSPSLSSVESLYIYKRETLYAFYSENPGQIWLDILCLFAAVKDIYLCETSADHIAFVLLELVEGRLTEVLDKPLFDGIVQSVAARELAGHHEAVYRGR